MKLLAHSSLLVVCLIFPFTVVAQTVPDKTGHSPFLKECYAKCAAEKSKSGQEGCMQDCKREDTKHKKESSAPGDTKAK